jgi:hypothetical protein
MMPTVFTKPIVTTLRKADRIFDGKWALMQITELDGERMPIMLAVSKRGGPKSFQGLYDYAMSLDMDYFIMQRCCRTRNWGGPIVVLLA